MKKVVSTVTAFVLLAGGLFTYRMIDACNDWQDRYKRFLYSELIKNSPMIYTPEMIDGVIGEPPAGCDRPSRVLSEDDAERFRREGVGPNEFAPAIRRATEPALRKTVEPRHQLNTNEPTA
jgi:hypothetical protein